MNDITDNQIEESTEVDDGRRWYFVHTYSGQEEHVKHKPGVLRTTNHASSSNAILTII
jgi:imidazoleglycerol phosphate synthase glutamine amidotransferase subunit HisH